MVCLSASIQVQDGLERRDSSFGYVQGSGDDHELWGHGLTPVIFWRNRAQLLSTNREDLDQLVHTLVASTVSSAGTPSLRAPSAIGKIAGRILLCSLSDELPSSHDVAVLRLVLHCTDEQDRSDDILQLESAVQIQEGKKGHMWYLQHVLPYAMHFVGGHLRLGRRVCIACPDGKDQGVGVALCALGLCFDQHGHLQLDQSSICTLFLFRHGLTLNIVLRKWRRQKFVHDSNGSYQVILEPILPGQL